MQMSLRNLHRYYSGLVFESQVFMRILTNLRLIVGESACEPPIFPMILIVVFATWHRRMFCGDSPNSRLILPMNKVTGQGVKKEGKLRTIRKRFR